MRHSDNPAVRRFDGTARSRRFATRPQGGTLTGAHAPATVAVQRAMPTLPAMRIAGNASVPTT